MAVTGEAGGNWYVERRERGWEQPTEPSRSPSATVTMDQDTAWRLVTKRRNREAIRGQFPDIGITLQVWVADDTDHRLDTTKLAKIIQIGTPLFPSMTLPVEVEYEQGVVSQYPVHEAEVTPSGVLLHPGTKHTACLAPDRCGVGAVAASCSTPGCC